MNRLFEGANVDGVYARFSLSNENYFTCGSTAEIYKSAKGILRLSSDAASHCIIVEGNVRGWAVPKLYQDYGPVAKTDEAGFDSDRYWLADIERLQPVSQFPELECQLKSWLSILLDPFGGDQIVDFRNVPRLHKYLIEAPLVSAFESVQRSLIEITALCNGDMDLGADNFMVRQSTGEVLLTDPAHGWWIDPAKWLCGGGNLDACVADV